MPLAAPKRVVSIDYAHRYGYELAVDAAEAVPELMRAQSHTDSRKIFRDHFEHATH
tara:strand:- start:48 stop:215 length:168 start_codon:yes stop_codon:yes gene_type:complete